MTTLRSCPVCQSTVPSSGSSHCPECGAELGLRESSDEESKAVDDIIKKVREQIVPPDDAGDTQPAAAGNAEGRDISEILSDAAFQSILKANRNSDEGTPGEEQSFAPETPAAKDGGAGPESSGEPDTRLDDDGTPFSTVLGSFKQAQAQADSGAVREDAPTGSSAADQECDARDDEEDRPAAEPDYPGRPEPAKETETPKPRTWWGSTRQILWLMLVLLACIIFFRVFGPERKRTNIEDFFRPGDQDIEFLEALEFLEKYYEKKRKQKSGIADFEVGETLPADTQPAHVPDAEPETPAGQAPDTAAAPARNVPSPASKGPQP